MTTDDQQGSTQAARVVQITGPLSERIARAVETLATLTAEVDGVGPLDDDARLGLRQAHEPARRHLLATRPAPGSAASSAAGSAAGSALGSDDELTAYAQLDPGSAQVALFVAPAARRSGIGSALLAAAVRAAHDDPVLGDPVLDDSALDRAAGLSGWAHGDLPAAAAFARHHRLVATRRLFQLRLDLTDDDSVATSSAATSPAATSSADTPPTGTSAMPPGYRLRGFVPGQDDAGWVALNAAAFVDLPDQGGLTLADLSARMREPWFDPAGLLLAETLDGELAGFHWTKVHDSTEDDPTPAGEVYVLGVHPGHQRTGLGRALLAAGLEHLRRRGTSRVLLYVDAANTPALRLYERLGFAVHRTDTLYSTQP